VKEDAPVPIVTVSIPDVVVHLALGVVGLLGAGLIVIIAVGFWATRRRNELGEDDQ
jgi:hypothetical protein